MRTGQFIKVSYQKEIDRIQKEITNVIPYILAEREILDIQSRIKIHENFHDGQEYLHYNCGGSIIFRVKTPTSKTYGNSQTIFSIDDGKVGHDPSFTLEEYHLKTLQSIHPKRFPELLRASAKKLLLHESPEVATKPWWKFW